MDGEGNRAEVGAGEIEGSAARRVRSCNTSGWIVENAAEDKPAGWAPQKSVRRVVRAAAQGRAQSMAIVHCNALLPVG